VQVLAGPGVLYAIAQDTPWTGGLGTRLVAIFRSTDGGQTWEQTWPGAGNGQPWPVMAEPEIRADGAIAVLSGDHKLHVSKDGGRTFQESELTPATRPGIWTRGGYFSGPSALELPKGPYPYRLSTGASGEIPRPQ
jgi:hypothetical protein